MRKVLPVGLVCKSCGDVFGTLLEPPADLLPEGAQVEAICTPCVGRLSREKGIVPNTPESWEKLTS